MKKLETITVRQCHIPIFPALADDLRVVVVFCHATSPQRWADYAVEQQSAGSVLWPERDKAQCGIELGPASQQSWLHALKQGENTRWVVRLFYIKEYGRKGRFSLKDVVGWWCNSIFQPKVKQTAESWRRWAATKDALTKRDRGGRGRKRIQKVGRNKNKDGLDLLVHKLLRCIQETSR